jgi:hypothetical protein
LNVDEIRPAILETAWPLTSAPPGQLLAGSPRQNGRAAVAFLRAAA